ncbi:beta-lactamase family protein, partial [Vibrio cholerae CP1035(8)]
HFTIN